MNENNTKNLLMVLESQFPTVGGGGAEKQVQTLCRHLPDNVNATIITPRVVGGSNKVHDQVDGIQVIRIAYPHIPHIGGIIMLIKLAYYIFANRKKISAIHCHIANNMAAISCLMGWCFNMPTVVKLTGWLELEYGILSNNNSFINKFKRSLIKKATAIQATSHDMERRLLDLGFASDRVHFIPNSVDTHRFKSDASIKSTLKNNMALTSEFVMVFIGRLVPEKSLDTLLNAWNNAIDKQASADLLIIGEGVLRKDLESLADKLSISHQVKFVGAVSDVSDYLKISDIGVLPSEFEGLSNSLLESMAAGLPMIGSRVSGTVDMIEEGISGWTFKAGDIEHLSNIIAKAYSLPKAQLESMGTRSRKKIEETSSIEHVLSVLFNLYKFNQVNK